MTRQSEAGMVPKALMLAGLGAVSIGRIVASRPDTDPALEGHD